MNSIEFRLGVLACAAIAATPASAQEATSAGDLAEHDIVVTAGRAVTATKTDTPIVETPQAISVVPAELFLDRGARNVQETQRYSDGVTAEAFGIATRSETIPVRGLDHVQYPEGHNGRASRQERDGE